VIAAESPLGPEPTTTASYFPEVKGATPRTWSEDSAVTSDPNDSR